MLASPIDYEDSVRQVCAQTATLAPRYGVSIAFAEGDWKETIIALVEMSRFRQSNAWSAPSEVFLLIADPDFYAKPVRDLGGIGARMSELDFL